MTERHLELTAKLQAQEAAQEQRAKAHEQRLQQLKEAERQREKRWQEHAQEALALRLRAHETQKEVSACVCVEFALSLPPFSSRYTIVTRLSLQVRRFASSQSIFVPEEESPPQLSATTSSATTFAHTNDAAVHHQFSRTQPLPRLSDHVFGVERPSTASRPATASAESSSGARALELVRTLSTLTPLPSTPSHAVSTLRSLATTASPSFVPPLQAISAPPPPHIPVPILHTTEEDYLSGFDVRSPVLYLEMRLRELMRADSKLTSTDKAQSCLQLLGHSLSLSLSRNQIIVWLVVSDCRLCFAERLQRFTDPSSLSAFQTLVQLIRELTFSDEYKEVATAHSSPLPGAAQTHAPPRALSHVQAVVDSRRAVFGRLTAQNTSGMPAPAPALPQAQAAPSLSAAPPTTAQPAVLVRPPPPKEASLDRSYRFERSRKRAAATKQLSASFDSAELTKATEHKQCVPLFPLF
jgi:hypothetical protein